MIANAVQWTFIRRTALGIIFMEVIANTVQLPIIRRPALGNFFMVVMYDIGAVGESSAVP